MCVCVYVCVWAVHMLHMYLQAVTACLCVFHMLFMLPIIREGNMFQRIEWTNKQTKHKEQEQSVD